MTPPADRLAEIAALLLLACHLPTQPPQSNERNYDVRMAPASLPWGRVAGFNAYAYPTMGYSVCLVGWCVLRCPVPGEECYL